MQSFFSFLPSSLPIYFHSLLFFINFAFIFMGEGVRQSIFDFKKFSHSFQNLVIERIYGKGLLEQHSKADCLREVCPWKLTSLKADSLCEV